jgi:hypothetical protein
VTRQRADGGWSQLDSLPADAYATGMSLCALHEAGISVTDPPLPQRDRMLVEEPVCQRRLAREESRVSSTTVLRQWVSLWPASVDLCCWLELGVVSDSPHVADENGRKP